MSAIDNTQPIEPFLKDFLASLDIQYQSNYANVESYATQFAKHLKRTSAVIVNGSPLIPTNNDSKLEFQKKWLAAPLTQHQLSSFDCHLIPGTGTFIINLSCKVKFDESGKNRLGESADLIQDPSVGSTRINPRPIWSSWFGANINLVVDESVLANSSAEVISSLDYRITFKPENSVIQL
ncbi:mRNA transport regulator MTR2 [Suhomyces tanzawaensis NRRL Y-17324]|uniref:mRNA transport regulator MTR2 n=1 Tax=Suhomyces tanzawaensis NRRL Y-17324 TaxID=984487 RepID=A0A1E4SSK0_9ASCO|nr:mRNA transport regulator MTR2 [Suhomyces tanzawaensis NRRL Y-17324]ODV82475.1 mRNA transport regulator MTR2 [Suhomyces tanzawaensis NRRL Y-17324]